MKIRDGREVETAQLVDSYRYNMYLCEVQHRILSVDIDTGVTPMFITCRLRRNKTSPICGARAVSQMYPPGPPPEYLFPVNVVWRKPTKSELKQARRDNMLDHFTQGGLQMEWVNELS